MTSAQDFHEVRFPLDVALGSSGGPQRRTEIVTLGSGHEQRNQRWLHSRRRYDAGYGIKSLDKLQEIVAFFEARRGPLYGFLFRDAADYKSCLPSAQPTPLDQQIGTGDGIATTFQLTKSYGGGEDDVYLRIISKPVADSVVVALDGEVQDIPADFDVDISSGTIAFNTAPAAGKIITAGFEFDVPVRFDSDALQVNLAAFSAGDVPSIPLVEVRV